MSWANDRLSVHASDAPLSQVIAEVARLTGLKVVGADKLQGSLTVDFDDLAAIDALKALLTDVNYFVQQDAAVEKGRIGLVVRVHSMARVNAASAPADRVMRLPAIDTLIEAETQELEDEKQEAADDPDLAEENKQYLDTARQLAEIGEFGGSASAAALERYAESDNPQIRLEAVKALAQRPIAASLPTLVEALSDDSIEVRRAAIDALGRASDRESLLHVGRLLETDEDLSVRYAALRIFALRADPAATPHLKKVANDEDLTIRDAARQMLAELDRLAKEKRPPL